MQDSLFQPATNLQVKLEESLKKRFAGMGATLFTHRIVQVTTPAGRMVMRMAASGRPTSASGCTSLPTPKEQNSIGITPKRDGLYDIAMLSGVPTPQTHDVTTRGNTEADGHYYPHDLSNAAALSSVVSPQEGDAHRGGQAYRYLEKAHAVRMNDQVMLSGVPTPKASEAEKDSRTQDGAMNEVMRGKGPSLSATVGISAVTTPSARDWKDTTGMSESGVDPDGSTRSRLDQLPRQAQLAVSGQTAIGGTDATASTGQLDPAYSRWLMGLPPVFCDCAVTVTALRRPSRKRSSKALSSQ